MTVKEIAKGPLKLYLFTFPEAVESVNLWKTPRLDGTNWVAAGLPRIDVCAALAAGRGLLNQRAQPTDDA